MEGITNYLMIIVGLAFGVLLISRRFVKSTTTREFKYNPKSQLLSKEEVHKSDRINFRKAKKNYKITKEPEKYSNFRQAYNKALEKSHKRSNVELNSTFWIVLVVLLILVFGIFGFDFSIFAA